MCIGVANIHTVRSHYDFSFGTLQSWKVQHLNYFTNSYQSIWRGRIRSMSMCMWTFKLRSMVGGSHRCAAYHGREEFLDDLIMCVHLQAFALLDGKLARAATLPRVVSCSIFGWGAFPLPFPSSPCALEIVIFCKASKLLLSSLMQLLNMYSLYLAPLLKQCNFARKPYFCGGFCQWISHWMKITGGDGIFQQ